MGRKLGAVPLWGSWVPMQHNVDGPRPTSLPSFILIHPTVWSQYTNVTDRQDRQTRQDRQRSDSIKVNRFTNGHPKLSSSICIFYYQTIAWWLECVC